MMASTVTMSIGDPLQPLPLLTFKQRRKRKPTLASALKQASKAGASVAGATITPDGSVKLEFGDVEKTDQANGKAEEKNEWDSIQ
jgi:hypothetical protein